VRSSRCSSLAKQASLRCINNRPHRSGDESKNRPKLLWSSGRYCFPFKKPNGGQGIEPHGWHSFRIRCIQGNKSLYPWCVELLKSPCVEWRHQLPNRNTPKSLCRFSSQSRLFWSDFSFGARFGVRIPASCSFLPRGSAAATCKRTRSSPKTNSTCK